MHLADARLAVLAAPVPAADRRGLSQAWFSALHLADAPRVLPRTVARPDAAAVSYGATAERASATRVAPTGRDASPPPRPVRAAAAAPPAPPGERRNRPSALARTIAREVGARRAAGGTLTLASENGRVRLVVRVDGARTRIVALCAPGDRATVAAALGAARYALARDGAHVDVDLRAEA